MYALQDNSMWSMPALSARQGYYGGMPTLVFAAPPTINQINQPIFYQIQPAVYAPIRPTSQSRPRLPSDDVFLPGGNVMYNVPMYNFQKAPHETQNLNQQVILTQNRKEATYQDSLGSKASSLGSQPSSNSSSPSSTTGSSGHNSSSESFPNPRKHNIGHNSSPEPFPNPRKHNIRDSFSLTSNSNSSSPSPEKFDSIIKRLIPASLCAAINDQSEPTEVVPLRTSSPIRRDVENKSMLIDFSNMRKRRGRELTSSSSGKCPRFSENGVCEDLDQCDRILIKSREPDVAEEAAKKREEFLLILEAERERQKKIVLTKHASKMSCKFCRNNGESSDVFTKHKLHHNEKTVCPILRHYVCRLCNSTGDFAHTIRHCPFNDRKDKIAWKATFLV